MRKLYFICFFVAQVFVLNTMNALANEEIFANDVSMPKENASTKKWYPTGEPQGDKGEIWEEGVPVEELNRRRVPLSDKSKEPKSINTRAGINAQLKNISEYERGKRKTPLDNVGASFKNESSVEEGTWRPEITEPVKIDEDVLDSNRYVVGAHANMVEEDNFSISAGPELHLTEDGTSPLVDADERPQNSEIGMGMKFTWGF